MVQLLLLTTKIPDLYFPIPASTVAVQTKRVAPKKTLIEANSLVFVGKRQAVAIYTLAPRILPTALTYLNLAIFLTVSVYIIAKARLDGS